MKKTDRLRRWLKVALWFVPSAYAVNFLYALGTDQSGGTFGDTFGAANALFSGTALMMLVFAVILQREELELVKEERSDTRRLLEGQERINKLQEVALKKQNFEQSFFALVQLISQERQALDAHAKGSSRTTIAERAANSAKAMMEKTGSLLDWDLHAEISECGTVVRLLIATFGFLEEQEFDPAVSVKYISTLHAMMDADLAHVFLVLVARWEDGDPRAIPAFDGLQCREFLQPQFKGFARKLVERGRE